MSSALVAFNLVMVLPLLSFIQRKAVRLRLIMSAAAVLQILPPAAPPTPVQKTVTRDDCKVSIYCFFSYQKRVLKNC